MIKNSIKVFAVLGVLVLGLVGVVFEDGVFAADEEVKISETKMNGIINQCETIIHDLKQVQKQDARARVYFGGYYETILTKFITPMNMRLVENNLSTVEFVENQNNYLSARTNFINDYINYQKNLEELITINCKAESAKFYKKLETTRVGREKVSDDIKKMSKLINKYSELVKGVEAKI